jgi:hypothetical protein
MANPRLSSGFVAASAAAALGLATAVGHPVAFLFFLPFTFVLTLLTGLPAYLILSSAMRLTLPRSMIVGFSIGAVPTLMFFYFWDDIRCVMPWKDVLEMASSIASVGGSGALGGFAFWFVMRRSEEGARGFARS